MAETIYTIPINEAFDKYDGCPLCRLRQELETASLEYVMGAAMMEPDVRIKTNALGFCRGHFDKMLEMKNRLGLALILESHLAEVEKLLSPPAPTGKKLFGGKKDVPSPGAALLDCAGSCFVCDRVRHFEEKYISNTVYLWKSDKAFREKLKKQPMFCLEHAGALLEQGNTALSSALYSDFSREVLEVVSCRLTALKADLCGFTRSFDHRYSSQPLTDAQRSSVENITGLLSGK